MIDRAKRVTLKRIGSVAMAATSLSAAAHSLAYDADENALPAYDYAHSEIADLKLHTRVSALSNDIEVVITNVGQKRSLITQMTPSQTVTKRGHFDFSSLLENGDLCLAPGQSVTVPMTPNAVVLDASTNVGQRADSLTNALRKSFSVITENESFARVSIVDQIRFS